MQNAPFHLAFPVKDLSVARHFYAEILQCQEGRSCEKWIDFDFFGNQITAHKGGESSEGCTNLVDTQAVLVPHFGAILEWHDFYALAERLENHDVQFIYRPRVRFEGKVGEQATMFIQDGNGNVLEFKSFRDPSQVFAR